MKARERGYTLIETAVVVSLVAMISLAGSVLTFHSVRSAKFSENRLTAIANAANAGYWLSHDAYMADNVIADNLTSPAILILKWTDWGYGTANVYHSATYSIENVSGGVGQLKRLLQDSVGTNQQFTVADYIYYDLADPTNSTNVTYQSPTISLKVATKCGSASEARSYQISRRPNF